LALRSVKFAVEENKRIERMQLESGNDPGPETKAQ
jgi:hypothetical protein